MKSRKGLLPVRWWVAVLLFLSYVVWYMDRTNISIAGPVMMKHFGWSAATFGMVQSSFFIGYALTQIPGGWLADRLGGSKVIFWGTIWWSIFVFLTPLAPTLTMMYVVRSLMGLGEGVNAPTHSALTARWMRRSEAARAQSIYYIGMPVGIMITMPTVVWIIQTWGWQMAFFSFAFVGFVWCAFWWWYGRDKPEQHPKISQEELDYIKSDQDSAEVMSQPTDWKAIFTNRGVWGVSLAYFFHNYLWYLYMTWLPSYLVMSRGFTLMKSGLFTVIPYFVACITMPLGGILSDHWTKTYGPNIGKRLPIVIGLGGCGIFLVLAAHTPNAYTAIAYVAASVGFLTLNYGAFWSAAIDLSAKDAGVITGFMNTSGNIAGIFAPTITGMLVTFYNNKFENALYFGAFLAVVGIVILWTCAKIKPIKDINVGLAGGIH
jgi:sugar phosphate permease